LEHPAEEHVLRSRTRCILAPPVVENPNQRAANVYSADETTYNAPKYCASVGDGLRQTPNTESDTGDGGSTLGPVGEPPGVVCVAGLGLLCGFCPLGRVATTVAGFFACMNLWQLIHPCICLFTVLPVDRLYVDTLCTFIDHFLQMLSGKSWSLSAALWDCIKISFACVRAW
jgi:hypothetical protein